MHKQLYKISTTLRLSVVYVLAMLAPLAFAESNAIAADATRVSIIDSGSMLPEDNYAPRLAPEEAFKAGPGSRRPEPDLWSELASAFHLLENAPAEPLAKPIARYRKQVNILKTLTSRSDPYMAYIVRQLRARDMPLEIALLPMIESGFDPFAYSPGRAAGLWQFIPMTAKHVGLRLTWWYDGRRDLIDGTNAALDYLSDLHRRFDNDWLLALAAYNAGARNVHRAMTRARRNGKEPTFWNLRLPAETQYYVPKLLALATVVQKHQEFGLVRPRLSPQQHFVSVATGGQLDLSQAANMAGITADELYRLNPGNNRWATDPEGPHRLLIPVTSQALFLDRLDQLQRQPRVDWHRYTVNKGDSLLELAAKFNTDTRTIQAVNKLKHNTIRVGQILMVPVSRQSGGYSLTEAQLAAAQIQRVKMPSHSRIFYTVKDGDSLWKIGRKFRVSYVQLKRWNKKTDRDVIKPGDKLVIWRYREDDGNDNGLAGGPGYRRTVHYSVRNGDSLDAIASRFNVAVNDIVEWNDIDPKKYIQPGQKIKLYVNVTGA